MCLGHALSHHVWWAGSVFLDHVLFALQKSCHIRLNKKEGSSPQVSRIGPLFRNLVQFYTPRGQAKNPRTNAAAALEYMTTNKRPVQKLNSIKSRYQPMSEISGIGCVCLGHALSRHGCLQPTFSTAPMGPPQLNDKVATIQRAGCVFLDHVLIAIKNFRRPSIHVCPEWLLCAVCVWTQYLQAV